MLHSRRDYGKPDAVRTWRARNDLWRAELRRSGWAQRGKACGRDSHQSHHDLAPRSTFETHLHKGLQPAWPEYQRQTVERFGVLGSGFRVRRVQRSHVRDAARPPARGVCRLMRSLVVVFAASYYGNIPVRRRRLARRLQEPGRDRLSGRVEAPCAAARLRPAAGGAVRRLWADQGRPLPLLKR